MLFHDKGNGEAFIPFPSTLYHSENGRSSGGAALKPGQGSEKPEGSRAMQLCRDWSRSDCSEGGESSRRGRTGPNPAPGLPALAGCWVVGMGGRMWSVPSYFHVSPTSCWETCINSAETALLLRVLLPCCIKMHRSFSVYLLILQGKEVVFTAEK